MAANPHFIVSMLAEDTLLTLLVKLLQETKYLHSEIIQEHSEIKEEQEQKHTRSI